MRTKALMTSLLVSLGMVVAVQGAAPKLELKTPAGCVVAKGARAGANSYADRIIHKKTGIELVLIPAGNFTMGVKDFYVPLRQVVIKLPFYMGRTELTNATYRKFISATGYNGKGDTDPAYDLYLLHWQGKSLMSQDDDYPIVCVSWKNAKAFCKWAGLKLPTEAQWEFSCRAGTTTTYYFGDDKKDLGDYSWTHANSQALTQPVARKKPNAWGLYDMLGNVWEWVEDDYVDRYDGGPSDGSARLEGKMTKVLRGGSWSNNTWFWVCSSGARFNSALGNASNNIGFRVVLPFDMPLHEKSPDQGN